MNRYGYIRVGAAVNKVTIADTGANLSEIIQMCCRAHAQGVELLVFPELSLTAYTCADLFMQTFLQESALEALVQLKKVSTEWPGMCVAVGLPLAYNAALYNCAALISDGEILGIVPKTFIPNYSEFYEKRWFATGQNVRHGACISIDGVDVPFGTDLLFDVNGVKVGMEICEDVWTPLPPSTSLALAGADVILNLSASNDIAAKHEYLISLLSSHSAALQCGYVYASAGVGESTTDVVYSGKSLILENGRVLKASERFADSSTLIYSDIDIELLRHDRRMHVTYADCAASMLLPDYRVIKVSSTDGEDTSALPDYQPCREVNADPFVPSSVEQRNLRCHEIVQIQTQGLVQRLRATGMKSVTVGISGGLDSTLAILIAASAFKKMGLPTSNIIAVTMPGFGTTDRTYDNAVKLIQHLGATFMEISIKDAVTSHFHDIGHDISVHDLTYENSQARERTQILMDISGQTGGMVLGTGDLSELALGWCTYNGDHMSMYAVNASVPKTLVRHLVQYFADTTTDSELSTVLIDVIDTPVSPELIPASPEGEITQKTEDLVGPYALHDFFLYNTLRYGFPPAKVYMLAKKAFADRYDGECILHWLRVFYRRFFTQQFKRSCMPDAPKVGSICLSPRGDWRMPSDACARQWLVETEGLKA